MERRNTEVVQSVCLRTLSVAPSTGLVREAQSALDLAERSYGATDVRTADMAVNLGRGLNDAEEYGVAVSVLQSALSIYDETGGDTSLRTVVIIALPLLGLIIWYFVRPKKAG
jgi:hypothetical protein